MGWKQRHLNGWDNARGTGTSRQLLDLLRGKDASEFDLRISVRAGHWFVSLSDPDVSGPPGQGEGKTFAEAWDDIKPDWHDAPT